MAVVVPTPPFAAHDERKSSVDSHDLFAWGDGVWSWAMKEGSLARICVQERRVAWVHCSTTGVNLAQRLADTLAVDLEGLRAHVASCRASGGRLAEYLAAAGVMTREQLRGVLAAHNAAHLSAFELKAWGDPTHFTPAESSYRYDEVFTFTLAELRELPAVERPCRPHAAPSALDSSCLDPIVQIRGVVGVALVDRKFEACVAVRGREPVSAAAAALRNLAVWNAAASAMTALGRPPPRELTVSNPQRLEIFRTAPCHSKLLYVEVDRRQTTTALAERRLQDVCDRVAAAHW